MKPGTKTLILGVCLLVLGAFVIPLSSVFLLVGNMPQSQQFIGPGTTEVRIGEPGRIYLWHDYVTLYQGVTYNRPSDLPDGLQIAISNADTGEPLKLVSDSSMSETVNGDSRVSIGYVTIDHPTTIKVAIAGMVPPSVFSVGGGFVFALFGGVCAGVGTSALAVLAGIGVVILGIRRRKMAVTRDAVHSSGFGA